MENGSALICLQVLCMVPLLQCPLSKCMTGEHLESRVAHAGTNLVSGMRFKFCHAAARMSSTRPALSPGSKITIPAPSVATSCPQMIGSTKIRKSRRSCVSMSGKRQPTPPLIANSCTSRTKCAWIFSDLLAASDKWTLFLSMHVEELMRSWRSFLLNTQSTRWPCQAQSLISSTRSTARCYV